MTRTVPAATLGATLGIIMGASSIPTEWTEPIGDRIVTIAVDRGYMFVPPTLTVLTDQVMDIVPHTLAAFDCVVKVEDAPTDLSELAQLDLADETIAKEICSRSPYAISHDFIHTTVTLDYCQAPEIKAGVPFRLNLVFENKLPDPRHMELVWHLPEGWTVSSGKRSNVLMSIFPSRVEVSVDVVADQVTNAVNRAILEIIVPGRPTVGLVPLLFFAMAG